MNSVVILLSNKCNLNCPYCFASSVRSEGGFITLVMYQKIINFFSKKNRGKKIGIRLAGGEPTLHPQFERILQITSRHSSIGGVSILTNGLFGRKKLEEILRFEPSKMNILLNFNDRSVINRKQQSTIERNIDALKHYDLTLSVNFYSANNSYPRVVELAKKHGLCIRWSLAHPVGGGNRFVTPRQFKTIKPAVIKFLSECFSAGLPVFSDCSVPLCLFEGAPDIYQKIYSCSSICSSPEVVDKNGMVFLCYDKSNSVNLFKFKNTDALEKYFYENKKTKQNNFWLKECRNCIYKDMNKCNGGCPYHIQLANDIDITNADTNNLFYHINENFIVYCIKNKKYYLKSRIGGAQDIVEISSIEYGIIKMLKISEGHSIHYVCKKMNRHLNLSCNDIFINQVLKELIEIGALHCWINRTSGGKSGK